MSVEDPILPDRRLRTAMFGLAFAALALLAIEVRLRVLHRTGDWLVFWSAARFVLEPGDIYTRMAPTGDFYIYPPLFALLLTPLRSMRPENAVVVWHFANIALLAGIYFEWRRVVRAIGIERSPVWLTISATLVAAMSCVSAMQGGQLGVFILYFIVLGLRLALAAPSSVSALASGAALAVPAVIKLAPGLIGVVLIVALLLARRIRTAILLCISFCASVAMFLFVIPAMALGWTRNLALLASFADRVVLHQVSMHYTSGTNHGFVQLMRTWGAPSWLTVAACVVYALAIGGAIVRMALRGRTIDLVVAASLACVASLFFSPVTWLHHFTLAMPFAAAAPVLLLERGVRQAKALSYAITAAFLFQHGINYFEPLEVTVLGLLVPALTVAFAVDALRKRPLDSPESAALSDCVSLSKDTAASRSRVPRAVAGSRGI